MSIQSGGGYGEGKAGAVSKQSRGGPRARKLPLEFVELPENGLGVLGEELRAAGLEHLLAAVLKQRTFKWTGGVD